MCKSARKFVFVFWVKIFLHELQWNQVLTFFVLKFNVDRPFFFYNFFLTGSEIFYMEISIIYILIIKNIGSSVDLVHQILLIG
jgi:hypothetical protein